MTIITIPMSVLDSNTQIQQLAMSALIKGAKPTYRGDDVLYPIESRYLPLDYAKLCLSVGAIVDQYPLFIEVDPDALVPNGIPNNRITDENGDEVQLTWDTWRNSNHEFLVRDGRTFLGTNANSNRDLPLSDLISVLDKLVHPNDLPNTDN